MYFFQANLTKVFISIFFYALFCFQFIDRNPEIGLIGTEEQVEMAQRLIHEFVRKHKSG